MQGAGVVSPIVSIDHPTVGSETSPSARSTSQLDFVNESSHYTSMSEELQLLRHDMLKHEDEITQLHILQNVEVVWKQGIEKRMARMLESIAAADRRRGADTTPVEAERFTKDTFRQEDLPPRDIQVDEALYADLLERFGKLEKRCQSCIENQRTELDTLKACCALQSQQLDTVITSQARHLNDSRLQKVQGVLAGHNESLVGLHSTLKERVDNLEGLMLKRAVNLSEKYNTLKTACADHARKISVVQFSNESLRRDLAALAASHGTLNDRLDHLDAFLVGTGTADIKRMEACSLQVSDCDTPLSPFSPFGHQRSVGGSPRKGRRHLQNATSESVTSWLSMESHESARRTCEDEHTPLALMAPRCDSPGTLISSLTLIPNGTSEDEQTPLRLELDHTGARSGNSTSREVSPKGMLSDASGSLCSLSRGVQLAEPIPIASGTSEDELTPLRLESDHTGTRRSSDVTSREASPQGLLTYAVESRGMRIRLAGPTPLADGTSEEELTPLRLESDHTGTRRSSDVTSHEVSPPGLLIDDLDSLGRGARFAEPTPIVYGTSEDELTPWRVESDHTGTRRSSDVTSREVSPQGLLIDSFDSLGRVARFAEPTPLAYGTSEEELTSLTSESHHNGTRRSSDVTSRAVSPEGLLTVARDSPSKAAHVADLTPIAYGTSGDEQTPLRLELDDIGDALRETVSGNAAVSDWRPTSAQLSESEGAEASVLDEHWKTLEALKTIQCASLDMARQALDAHFACLESPGWLENMLGNSRTARHSNAIEEVTPQAYEQHGSLPVQRLHVVEALLAKSLTEYSSFRDRLDQHDTLMSNKRHSRRKSLTK